MLFNAQSLIKEVVVLQTGNIFRIMIFLNFTIFKLFKSIKDPTSIIYFSIGYEFQMVYLPNSIKIALAIGHWQLGHLGIGNTMQCFA